MPPSQRRRLVVSGTELAFKRIEREVGATLVTGKS